MREFTKEDIELIKSKVAELKATKADIIEPTVKLYNEFLAEAKKHPKERKQFSEKEQLSLLACILASVKFGGDRIVHFLGFTMNSDFDRDQVVKLMTNYENIERAVDFDESGNLVFEEKINDAPAIEEDDGEIFNTAMLTKAREAREMDKFFDVKIFPTGKNKPQIHSFRDLAEQKLREIDEAETRTSNPVSAKTAAKYRLFTYAKLKKRGEERSWGEVFKHPIKTYKEWKFKKDLKTNLCEKYALSEVAIDRMATWCYSAEDVPQAENEVKGGRIQEKKNLSKDVGGPAKFAKGKPDLSTLKEDTAEKNSIDATSKKLERQYQSITKDIEKGEV